MFGHGLNLPTWVQDVSPFTHCPRAPAATVTAAPLLALTAACVTFAAAGPVSPRRRNLALPI